jgi:hypothetical protein
MTTYDFPAPPAVRQPGLDKKRKGLVALLAFLLALTLLIALLAIGGYFYLRNNRSTQWSWQDPQAAVDSARVRPDLGVLALLDTPAGSLVRQAVQANEPDTAFALLATNIRSSDAERSGSAQLIGRAFEQIPAPDLAALSFQQMLDIAALSPTMADPMRAQVSLDAARGFARLGLADAARPAMQQAETLARYSPLLAPVQRQDVARQLQTLYQELGQPQQAAALDQLVREPRGIPTGKYVRGPFLPGFVAPTATPEPLQRAIEERQRQVYTFLVAWDSGDPRAGRGRPLAVGWRAAGRRPSAHRAAASPRSRRGAAGREGRGGAGSCAMAGLEADGRQRGAGLQRGSRVGAGA